MGPYHCFWEDEKIRVVKCDCTIFVKLKKWSLNISPFTCMKTEEYRRAQNRNTKCEDCILECEDPNFKLGWLHESHIPIESVKYSEHNKLIQPLNNNIPLKSTSPLPSLSNTSMTLCTSGFCWSSGSDINSSTLREPELSKSSFLNLLPKRLISSASTVIHHKHQFKIKKQKIHIDDA